MPRAMFLELAAQAGLETDEVPDTLAALPVLVVFTFHKDVSYSGIVQTIDNWKHTVMDTPLAAAACYVVPQGVEITLHGADGAQLVKLGDMTHYGEGPL